MHAWRIALVSVSIAVLLASCASKPIAAAPITTTKVSTVTTLATTTATAVTTEVSVLPVTTKVQVTHTTVKLVPTTVMKTVTKVVVSDKTATVTAQPAPAAGSFGDGTYLVGSQIQPGTYQASNATPASSSDLCYWETSTKTGDIIDNGVNDGVMYVPSDAFSVRVDGCGTWKLVG